MDQEVNQKRFFIPSRKWWLILQCGMILILFVVGLIKGGDINILPHRIVEALFFLGMLIIAYPWGIKLLFYSGPLIFTQANFPPRYILLAGSIIYYVMFFIIINYVCKYKKFSRMLALALLIVMLLNFAGCARVVHIPLIIT